MEREIDRQTERDGNKCERVFCIEVMSSTFSVFVIAFSSCILESKF